MGYFDKYITEGSDVAPSLYEIEQEGEQFVSERNAPMDYLHDLWMGTGEAMKVVGSGIGMDPLEWAGEAIGETSFAKPDVSQFYGTQGRVGRVTDMIATSLPLTLGLAGTTAVGTAAAGPVGGAAALTAGLGAVGKGVFNQSYEEIAKEAPDLPDDQKFQYALINGLSEAGSEGLGMVIPFGIGKMAGKLSKPALKNIMRNLVASGRISPNEAIGTLVKGVGGKEAVASLFGGAASDGASEVVNELVQSANRASVGLEENPVDLIDLFLAGSAPGGIIAGGTMAMDANIKNRVRADLESRLMSPDVQVRKDAVDFIADGLNNLEPELGALIRSDMKVRAEKGPISVDELIEEQKTERPQQEIKQTIIGTPELVLKDNGIPVGGAAAKLRTDDRSASLQQEQDIIAGPQATSELQVGQAVEAEMMQRDARAQEVFQKAQEREALAEGKMQIVQNFMGVSRDSTDFDQAYFDVLLRNDVKSRAIEKGMSEVIQDTNDLTKVESLEERAKLRRKIERNKKLIEEEMQDERVPVEVQEGSPSVVEGQVEGTSVQPEVIEETPQVAPQETISEVKVPEDAFVPQEQPEAYTTSEDLLDEKGLERASKLIQEGVNGDDAYVLAKKGIESVETPVEIEGGRWSDGTVVEKGTQTKGKKFKVIGKDGIERRAGTQKEYEEAIRTGTVDQLLPFEQKERSKDTDKELPKLNEGQRGQVEKFLKDNPLTSFSAPSSFIAEAIPRVIAKGEELTKKNVNKEAKRLQKSEENVEDTQKMQRANLRGDVVPVEELYASEEAKVGQEPMDDVEVEDTIGEGEETEGNIETAGEVAIPIQKGKGKADIKKYTYFKDAEGNWKRIGKDKAKELPEGVQTEVREETPDGKYTLRTNQVKGEDGITKITVDIVDQSGQTIANGLPDKQAAMDYLKWDADLELESIESDGARIAQAWMESSGLQLAIINLKDIHADTKDPALKEAIDILVKIRDEQDAEAQEMRAKYPSAYELLESTLKPKLKSEGNSAKLADYLMKRANVNKLKDIKVVLGDGNSFDTGTNRITLRKYASNDTKVHEVVHALTVNEMRGNKEMQEEILSLKEMTLGYLKDAGLFSEEEFKFLSGRQSSQDFKGSGMDWGLKRPIAYAMINEYEFLSQAFSSSEFQSVLDKIKVKGEKSILDKLIDFVMKALGFNTKDKTLMRKILEVVPEISYMEPIGSKGSMKMEMDVPITDQEVSAIMAGKEPSVSIKEKLREGAKDIRNFAESVARPIADIIRDYSQKIYSDLMKFESRLIMKQKEYSTKVKPFMQWYNKLSKSEQVRYNLALMNSNTKENQEIIKEIPKDIMKGVNEVLDDLRMRSEEVGLGTTDREYYFPRRVTDVNGLMDYLLEGEEYRGPIGYAFQEEAKRLGVKELTDDQRTQVMTDMFQAGYLRQLPRPGASKKRTIPFVSRDTYKFYADANDSLMGHIFEMNEKVGQREFIGGSTRKVKIQELLKEYRKIEQMADGEKKLLAIAQYDAKAKRLEDLEGDLEESVASMVYKEMGKSPAGDQMKIMDLLNSRLRQKGAHGVVDAIRNVGYITTMGNFLSSITQLGDIPILFYAHGVNQDSLSAVGTAFKNVWKIAKNEFGGKTGETDAFVDQADFTNQLREFSQGSVSAKWVEKAFQYSGLKFTDLIGKEAFMQAAYKKWQRKGNKDAFMERYEPMFGKDTEGVYQDIQKGKRTDDIIAVLLSELSDFQPITLSQQSQKYLTGGNMRIFYMLKTFTLRATSAALREAATEINQGNVATGIAKASTILMIYALAGAGADELKDLIRGKESTVTDNTVDNLLQMFFLSRYSLDKGIKQENLTKTLLGELLPPMRYMDTLGADVYSLMSSEKDFKFKSLQNVPLVGTAIYSRSSAGQSGFAKIEKRDILDAVRNNKKKGKGAYSGDISKRVREYNKRVGKEERISNDTIMKAYRQ